MSAMLMVGLPYRPSLFVTLIWLAVPRISMPVTLLLPVKATMPVLLPKPANTPTMPDRLTVGLPEMPSPLVTAMPGPEETISRGTTVPRLFLATKPLPASFRLLAAPVRPMVRGSREPPSVMLRSPVTANARLLGRDGSWLTVRNV